MSIRAAWKRNSMMLIMHAEASTACRSVLRAMKRKQSAPAPQNRSRHLIAVSMYLKYDRGSGRISLSLSVKLEEVVAVAKQGSSSIGGTPFSSYLNNLLDILNKFHLFRSNTFNDGIKFATSKINCYLSFKDF